MPGGDGTGPSGLGPMTRRGVGYCAGFETPGYANPIPCRYAGVTGWTDNSYAVGVTRGYQAGRPRLGRGMGRGRGRMGWSR